MHLFGDSVQVKQLESHGLHILLTKSLYSLSLHFMSQVLVSFCP